MFEFTVTQATINPDCSDVYRPALLVNGQLPGPAITAMTGERVRVKVWNGLPKRYAHNETFQVTIHFHGIRQIGSNEADGVPYLTQRPIPPGEYFIYDFRVVDQAGTYFYHAHVGLQEETVMGPLIVYESPEADPAQQKEGKALKIANAEYDEERTIVISEWWHQSRLQLEDYIMGPTFVDLPESDSVLLNGRTLYDKWGNGTGRCDDGGGYSVVEVESGKVYRLRFIGAATFRSFGVRIPHHTMTIIEVDGDLVQPYTVDFIELSPGQRISVLLHANKPTRRSDYAIDTVRQYTGPINPYSNGVAVLRYVDTKHKSTKVTLRNPLPLPPMVNTSVPFWIWNQLRPLKESAVIQQTPSRTLILQAGSQVQGDGSTRWFVNQVAFIDPKKPLIDNVHNFYRTNHSSSTNTSAHPLNPYRETYPVARNEIIDIVIQNTHRKGEPCRSHPWHTHGHSHWELAAGPGDYLGQGQDNATHFTHPVHKDTTLVYPLDDEPNAVGTHIGCGWTKIRMLADNPGVWAVHCHNAMHMVMGMMVVFEVAPDDIITTPVIKSY